MPGGAGTGACPCPLGCADLGLQSGFSAARQGKACLNTSRPGSTTEPPLCATENAQCGFPELTPGKVAAAQGELLFFAFLNIFFSLTNF